MLASKLAVVTGGASGIGYKIARIFAREGAGVCLVDIQSDVQDVVRQLPTQSSKYKHTSHICDISNSTEVNNLFKTIKETHKETPTIIVNSAGITRDNILIKIPEADFDKVIQVNLKGTFLVSQTAAKELVSHYMHTRANPFLTYASIINIGSIVGKNGNIGQANYSASKAGVEGLTKTMSKELGRYHIRVNAIIPGFIRTPMTDKVPKKHMEKLQQLIPLGRVGEPEEIANLALFLASDMSSYVTGSSIDCNGGLSI